MDIGLTRIVRFDIFCPNCKYYKVPEEDRPCYECLSTPAVEHSKVPIHYTGLPNGKTIIELLEEANNSKMDEQWKQYIEKLIKTKVDKVEGKQLSTNDLTDEIMDKITKEIPDNIMQLSLAIANKVVKEEGKGLSSNDFTDEYVDKIDNQIPNDISVLEAKIPKKLNDLIDVELENLKKDQIMAYDEENQQFKNIDMPETGGGSLTDDLEVAVDVGGIHAGTTYEAGTDIEDVLSDMLEPTLYPTFVAPSANIAANPGITLYERGSSQQVTFSVSFNRGSIRPAYGTSGHRSGNAISYVLNGGTPQSGNTFSRTVSESSKYKATVNYEAGEQPKDSKGGDYGSPLPAGNVNSNEISFEFVNAIWANTGNIVNVTKQTLVSKSAKVKEFNFPAQTIVNPEIFDVPASWTVTAVEVLNTLSNQWEDCKSEFTISDTIHPDAGGTTVNYKRYTDNRGYAAAGRKIRVKWSN